jgi:hypothetical protein
MLRLLPAAALLAALSAGAAHAQYTGPMPGTGGFDDQQFYWNVPVVEGYRSPAQRARDEEIERRYREVVDSRIPDKKPSKDPWRTIRQEPAATYDRHKVE